MDQNTIRETTDSVIVAAKVRPLLDYEHKMGKALNSPKLLLFSSDHVQFTTESLLIPILDCKRLIRTNQESDGGEVIVCNSEKFHFDFVFDSNTSNGFVYSEMVSGLIDLAFKGHHVAVLVRI